MSTSKPIQLGMRTFIPIAVDHDHGCDGCVAWQAGPINMCHKLPKCYGTNFAVIYKEID